MTITAAAIVLLLLRHRMMMAAGGGGRRSMLVAIVVRSPFGRFGCPVTLSTVPLAVALGAGQRVLEISLKPYFLLDN